jgi:hypothetical protein
LLPELDQLVHREAVPERFDLTDRIHIGTRGFDEVTARPGIAHAC